MKIDAGRFAAAAAIVTSVLWLVCSALVSLAPSVTMSLTEDMVHADLSALAWSLSWNAVLVGLVSWTVSTTVAAFLLAWTYNHLARTPST